MTEHVLKTWPEFFSLVWEGVKPFEIRENDRNFARFDKLVLREFVTRQFQEAAKSEHPEYYTGRVINICVKHVLFSPGLKPGFVVLILDMKTKLNFPLNLAGKPTHPKFAAVEAAREGLT
jgi:hypothetical protein